MDTPGAAFDSFTVAAERQTARYGDKPFLTWYDDRRDERVELSFKTFENWVAKTANLLVEELGAGPGDRVGIVAVDHWQMPVVAAACWRAGCQVVALEPTSAPPPGLVAIFAHEDHLAGTEDAPAAAGGTPLVVFTADLLGRSAHDLGRALSFARVVPTMGDAFEGGPDPGDALGTGDDQPATMAGLLGRAAALAARTGLGDGDRLLSGLGLLTPAGAAAGLLAPFTAGAGVVLPRPFDPARFWKRVADERVAVAVLDPDQAAALLAGGPPPAGLDRSRLRLVACQDAGEAVAAGFPDTFDVPLLDDLDD